MNYYLIINIFILLICVCYCTKSNEHNFYQRNLFTRTTTSTSCSSHLGKVGANCSSTDDCQYNLVCVYNKCAYVTYSTSCVNNSDCGQNSDFTCVNGTCNTNRYPNDPCTANVQCFSNNCTNGFCVSNKVNQSCTGNDCVPGSFCNPATNTCQTSLKLGSNCSTEFQSLSHSSRFVDLFAICSQSVCNINTCVSLFSVPNGGNCLFSILCQSNNCNSSSHTCIPATNVTCNNNQPCPASNQLCICQNSSYGICEIDSCNSSFYSYIECPLKNNCPLFDDISLEGSCAFSSCLTTAENYLCCESNNKPNEVYVPSGVSCSSTTSSSSTSSPSSTTSSPSSTTSSPSSTTSSPSSTTSSSNIQYLINYFLILFALCYLLF